jgi:muramidase (phage lysozyme)
MTVNIQKFLPSAASKGGALAKVSQNIAKGSSSLGITESAQKNIGVIRVKVIEIDDILKGTLASQKRQLDNQKRQQSSQRREKQEEKLETKPDAEKGQIKMPKAPRLGIFDWIKNFIGNVILGYFAVRLVDHLPKIIPIVKFIGSATDFLINVGGNLLNSLVTFIDWGYKAYDATRGFIKNIGGENFAKGFDKFIGAIDTALFLTTALAGSMAIEAMSGDDGGGLMDLVGDRLKGQAAQRAAQATGQQVAGSASQTAGVGAAGAAAIVAGAGLLASALGEGAFQLKKFGNKGVESAKKAYEGEKNWLMKPVRWGGYQLARFANFTLGTIGSLLDIVGAPFRYAIELIRYPFLSDEDKVKQANNLAKFDSRIREQFREGLNALTFGLAFKEKGSFGNIFGNKGAQKEMMSKMAGGGRPSTRGGKSISGPSRRVKKTKTKRTISVQPTPIKPGANVGGEKNIEKVFPKSKDKTKTSPLDYVESSYKKISDEPFFGPLMSISTKALVGQKPGKVDYKNAAQGLSNWMNVTFSDEILRTGALYAAGGGEINADMLSKKSGDMTDAIAKSLEDNISRRVDDAINDLMKQMMLQPDFKKDPSQEGVTQPTGEGDILYGTTPGEYGPILDLIASVEAVGGYDVVNGGKIDGLSKMTISAARQAALRSGGSGAMGRYQQMPQYVLDRARSIGLNPDRDLFSPENQDKLAVLLINGAGYKEWKSGSLTTEKFAHRLSATWRGLPEGPSNKTYQDRYASRNKAHTSWANVIATLNASKSGEISGGQFGGGILGTERVGAVDQFTPIAKKFGLQVTSDHRPGDSGYHGKNRARDYSNDGVGRGTPQQLAFAQHLVKNYGSSLSQLIYTPLGFGIANGKKVGLDYWGASTNSIHYDHVHVAFFHGGLVKKTGLHMLHQGEFVVDKDSVNLLGKDFIATINEVENKSQLKQKANSLISVLQNYTDYEMPSPEVVYIPVPIPNNTPEDYSSQSSGGLAMFAGGEADNPFKTLYQGT